jgi:hypothetical protein
MTRQCNALINRFHPVKYPVRVSSVVAGLGLEPQPVYSRKVAGLAGGSLDLAAGRIIIRTISGGPPTTGNELYYTRFCYAHEVAHALFYQTTVRPLARLAPAVLSARDKMIEEQLCNRGARSFLMPDKVMELVAGTSVEASESLLFSLINAFEVNLEPAAFRLSEWTAPLMRGDRFWMISKNDHLGGIPHCTACAIPVDLAADGVEFLAGRQPLNRVRPETDEPGKKWSLLSFITAPPKPGWDTLKYDPNVELLRTEKHIVKLRSQHKWIKWGSKPTYVWTEGSIEVVADRRRRRSRSARMTT